MNLLAGNYGPADKMQTAVAAYTPNVPWARFGGSKIVDWDGNGTSAATPQIAAAAALWIQKNRKEYEKYPQGWQRVEAVRAALFEKAKIDANYAKFFGRGKLAAKDMLDAVPAPANKLANRCLTAHAFPFLHPSQALVLRQCPRTSAQCSTRGVAGYANQQIQHGFT